MDSISIIIPVYNCEQYIGQCLQSIISQSGIEKEVIVVNDASSDKTKSICEEFQEKYSEIKLINLEENQGVSHARNIGIQNSKHEWIQFIDADDIIKKNILNDLKKNLNDTKYDLIIFGADYIYTNKIKKDVSNNKIICENKEEIANYLKNVTMDEKPRVLNVIWNKIYSKKIIEENNLRFDENISLGEDFLFNCNYFKKINTLMEINESYYNYYIRKAESLTTKFRTDILSRRIKVYNEWINLYKYYNIYDLQKEIEFEKFEGFLMYHSIYSIFSENNNLSEKEKIDFLSELINSQHIDTVMAYLKGDLLKFRERLLIEKKDVNKLYKYMYKHENIKKKIKHLLKK